MIFNAGGSGQWHVQSCVYRGFGRVDRCVCGSKAICCAAFARQAAAAAALASRGAGSNVEHTPAATAPIQKISHVAQLLSDSVLALLDCK